MFWLLITLLCLGLINWQLMIVVLGITMFVAYPVLLFVPVGVILLFFILKEGNVDG
jgi:hypothetical protein